MNTTPINYIPPITHNFHPLPAFFAEESTAIRVTLESNGIDGQEILVEQGKTFSVQLECIDQNGQLVRSGTCMRECMYT